MCVVCLKLSCSGNGGCEEAAVARVPDPPWTEVRDFTALLAYHEYPAARWNAMLPAVGAQVFVTYSFTEADAIPSVAEYSPYDATGYWSFDATQRDSTRAALAELSRVSGVVFVETSGEEAMVQFFGASGSSWGGWANYPATSAWYTGTSRVVIDQEGSFAPGTNAYQVILHEIGHAVGLKHPFSGDLRLPTDLNNTDQTLMSYTWSGGARSEFSTFDVQALQHLYGTVRDHTGWAWAMNGEVFTLTAGTGADVVIGVRTPNQLRGGAGDDHLVGRGMADTLQGGAGNDTLEAGEGANSLAGATGDDSMTGGGQADRITGGGGNDRLIGNDGDDRLAGDAGDDRIWGDDLDDWGWGADFIRGGAGHDWIDGGGNGDTVQGGAGNDRIDGGRGGNDHLSGDAGNDTIRGGQEGHKTISGGPGNDWLYGADSGGFYGGWDSIDGGAGNDVIRGEDGSDRLAGGAGSDNLRGGDGWDTMDGGPGNDRLFGEALHDELLGDAGSDLLDGGYGDDDLRGGTGNDTLSGGGDGDTLAGGAGSDRLSGGAGADRFVFSADDFGALDTVTDFTPGVDVLDLRGMGLSLSGLRLTDQPGGRACLLRAGEDDDLQILLLGVTAAELAGADIWI